MSSSHYRSQPYPPRKRPRGGNSARVTRFTDWGADYYDGGDRSNRSPREEGILTRLRKEFIALADPKPGSTAADDVDWVAKGLVSEYSRGETFKAGIHDLLFNCVLEIPPKILYYASLFVVANARKSAIGKDILAFSINKLKQLFSAGEIVKAKLMLRFVAGLTRIIEDDGVIQILSELVSKFEGHEPNVLQPSVGLLADGQARTNNLARLVLLTMPYIAASPKAPTTRLDGIFERMAPYMESQKSNEAAFVSPFKAPPRDELADFSMLHLLWLQTKTLKENEWDIPFLPRPWFAFRTELESATQPHPLPDFSLSLEITSIPPLKPEYYFSIFLDNEKNTVPQLNTIASTLIRDVLTDTIACLPFNRKESARLLIDLHAYFPTGLFHRFGTPLKDIPPPGPRPKYKLEDLVIDALFAELFRLPRTEEKEVFYCGVVTEVTKLAPEEIAPTLGRAIRWLYEQLGKVRGSVLMRFLSWFALHLSNFGFTYRWDEWVGDLTLDDGAAKKVFLRETIEKEVRLSYVERIQRTLPEDYYAILPEKPDVEDWKIVSQRFNAGDDSEKFIEALRAGDDVAITSFVDSSPNTGPLLVAGLLYISHETPYSHQISTSIVDLLKSHASKADVVSSIMKFWRDRPSTGVVLAMKYVDLGVCGVGDVVGWLLGQDGWMSRAWGWEIVHVCMEKVDSLTSEEAAQNGDKGEGHNGEIEGTMDVDSASGYRSTAGNESKNGRREIFQKIVDGVGACYERQTGELDREWLKEWFRMVVGTYCENFSGLSVDGWTGEILREAEEFRNLVS